MRIPILVVGIALICMSGIARDTAPMLGTTPASAAAADIIGAGSSPDGVRDREVPVEAVVATGVLAGLGALVLGIFRRRKAARSGAGFPFPAGGEPLPGGGAPAAARDS